MRSCDVISKWCSISKPNYGLLYRSHQSVSIPRLLSLLLDTVFQLTGQKLVDSSSSD